MKCAHETCDCEAVPEHGRYCSIYCANAAERESLPGEGEVEGLCSCGHDTCHPDLPKGEYQPKVSVRGER
jgi:hypothetical protein